MRYPNKLKKQITRRKARIKDLRAKMNLLASTPDEAFNDFDILGVQYVPALLREIVHREEDLLHARAAKRSKRILAAKSRGFARAIRVNV
jgi:hypothetical protein